MVEVTGEKLNRGAGTGWRYPAFITCMAQTLTLNDLRRLSKTLETEHLTDTLCIVVFVSIMYGSLNDLIIRIIIIIVYMQIFVSLL